MIILATVGGIIVTAVGAFSEWRPFTITTITINQADKEKVDETIDRVTRGQ